MTKQRYMDPAYEEMTHWRDEALNAERARREEVFEAPVCRRYLATNPHKGRQS